MAWHDVEDGVFPDEQEVVEVQLANGAVQLARFANRAWQPPTVTKPAAKRRPSAILKVIKWRSFAESLAASAKSVKVPSDYFVPAAHLAPEF